MTVKINRISDKNDSSECTIAVNIKNHVRAKYVSVAQGIVNIDSCPWYLSEEAYLYDMGLKKDLTEFELLKNKPDYIHLIEARPRVYYVEVKM